MTRTMEKEQVENEFYDLTDEDVEMIDDMADFYGISREEAYERFISGNYDGNDFDNNQIEE